MNRTLKSRPDKEDENAVLEAALDYAARGLSVIPVHGVENGRCTCRKPDCPSRGKHPALSSWKKYQQNRATEAEIRKWFSGRVLLNVGIVTGKVSGVVVLDIDGKEGLAALKEKGYAIPPTVNALSGGGGQHHLFAYPPGGLPNSAGDIADNVDVRGDGGIIVAAPSTHESGRSYEWIVAPGSMQLAEMPEWMAMETKQAEPATILRAEPAGPVLADLANLDIYVRAALAGEVAKVQTATEGVRNDTLVRAAFSLGQLEQAGLPFEVARAALTAAARATGLKPAEINNTIKSGWKAGREKPRDLDGVLPVPHHLTREQADLPAYPVEVFPEPAQAFVVGGAKAIGCPVELVAVPFLAYAGATIGSRFAIELKRGFQQWPVLWVACVAPTGSAKTPANEAARLPLEELQDEARERFEADYAAYELAMTEYDERRKAKKDRSDMSISQRFGGEGEVRASGKPEKPKMDHYFTTDATIEAVAEILSGSPGVAFYRDELVGWVSSFDAYKHGRGGERQQHLSMWSSSTLKVDRKGKDPIIVKRPVAAVVGAIQPVVLPDLTEEVGREDGFLERFLFSCPLTEMPRWTEETVPEELAEQATALFRSLRLPQEYPAQVFAPGVQEVWIEWFNTNADIASQSTGIMTGVHAKMPNQCARLALILHCLRWGAEAPLHVIERETLDGAIALVEYHRAHAAFVFQLLGQYRNNPVLRLQRRIERILREAAGAWLSRTDLDRALGGRVPARDRDEVLSRLVAAGLAEQQKTPSGSQGGHPAVCWRYVLGAEELEEPEKPEVAK